MLSYRMTYSTSLKKLRSKLSMNKRINLGRNRFTLKKWCMRRNPFQLFKFSLRIKRLARKRVLHSQLKSLSFPIIWAASIIMIWKCIKIPKMIHSKLKISFRNRLLPLKIQELKKFWSKKHYKKVQRKTWRIRFWMTVTSHFSKWKTMIYP
jgi:hypothetical protein